MHFISLIYSRPQKLFIKKFKFLSERYSRFQNLRSHPHSGRTMGLLSCGAERTWSTKTPLWRTQPPHTSASASERCLLLSKETNKLQCWFTSELLDTIVPTPLARPFKDHRISALSIRTASNPLEAIFLGQHHYLRRQGNWWNFQPLIWFLASDRRHQVKLENIVAILRNILRLRNGKKFKENHENFLFRSLFPKQSFW